MKTAIRCAIVAIAVCAWPIGVFGQTKDTKDAKEAARQDALVQEALARYDAGLARLKNADLQTPAAAGQPAPGGVRELRLEEAVALALEKNLDIAVQRLDPQAIDLQIAQFRNAYRPMASSTVGKADDYQLPRSQLVGGNQVNNATTTYNAAISQLVPKYGGNLSLSFNNNRVVSTSNNVLFNPAFTTTATLNYTQPLLRNFQIDNTRQQILVTQINREISEENLRATVTTTLANVRSAYWDLVFARSSVDVAIRALSLAEKLVEDNKARVEVGTLAPIDIVQAQAEAANNRQTLAAAEATLQTAELSLKRFLVSGTEDPLWRQELRPVDLPSLEPAPTDIEAAVRNALGKRTDLMNARRNIDSTDVSLRFFRNQSLPAVDLIARYGAQGIGGPRLIRQGSGGLGGDVGDTIPGGYSDALSMLSVRDYPTWSAQVNISYNIGGSAADAQYARSRVQRSQAVTRLRALELTVATEVTNAALQVQSNLKRVDAARAARELAQKRLEAEQSKFEVGMSTNFFVVQAQRDLADAENSELSALADYRKSLVTFERSQEAPANAGGGGNNNTNTGNTNTGGGGTNTGGTNTGGTGGTGGQNQGGGPGGQ
jgi:outer membrane protein